MLLFRKEHSKRHRLPILLGSIFFFLRPQRGNLIRGDSTFYFRSSALQRLLHRTPRIKHARPTSLYYAHYRHRLETGLLL